ncbi:MAG: sensor histidine kinase [Cellulosilyticaceae bacterium]
MGLRKQYQVKLSGLFIGYLFNLLVWSGIFLGIYIFFFSMATESGVILPANYVEHMVKQNKAAISVSEPLDRQLIPSTCKVGLFNKDYQYVTGEFDAQTVEDAALFLRQSNRYHPNFLMIERENGFCVIQYEIGARFASPVLDKLFPKLELTLIMSFFLLFLLLVILIAWLFAKRLKKELLPVVEATQQIKEKNLAFELSVSHIQEFNEVVHAIEDMKGALAQSLKKEWETEERRKLHIATLAHDLKTPLTIIKGNAELLIEEELSPEMKESVESIEKSSNQIAQYITLLIEATKDDEQLAMKKEKVKLEDFARALTRQVQGLCKSYQVALTEEVDIHSQYLIGIDQQSVLRAVMNVVVNAIEHTQERIKLQVIAKGNTLMIQVEDFGPGFTEEALKYACNQFFTQNTARTGSHYGLGLYITKQVVQGHRGTVVYENKEDSKGALITITLPVKDCE